MWPKQIIWLVLKKRRPFMAWPQCHHHCWRCFILRPKFFFYHQPSAGSPRVKWITAWLCLTLAGIGLVPSDFQQRRLNSLFVTLQPIYKINSSDGQLLSLRWDGCLWPQIHSKSSAKPACLWEVTTNNVISRLWRSVRVLMNDDQTDNIWQRAGISSLPKPNNTSPSISELNLS